MRERLPPIYAYVKGEWVSEATVPPDKRPGR